MNDQPSRRLRLRRWGIRTSKKTAVTLLIAAAAVFAVRSTLAEAFYVPTSSMTPEIQPGSRVLAWKLTSDFKPGDIVVYDGARGQALLGRVVRVDDQVLIVARNPEPKLTVARRDVIGRVVLNTR